MIWLSLDSESWFKLYCTKRPTILGGINARAYLNDMPREEQGKESFEKQKRLIGSVDVLFLNKDCALQDLL